MPRIEGITVVTWWSVATVIGTRGHHAIALGHPYRVCIRFWTHVLPKCRIIRLSQIQHETMNHMARNRNQQTTRRRRQKAPRQLNRHVKALDGLRALAIISVVLYHLSVPWLPSGHMGVVLFLVLTGYLASSSVLRAIRRGTLSLPRLWLKRIVRIWPPMAVMIVFTVALCALFNHVLLTKLKPDLLPSLLLSNNVGAILRGASYFDNLGGTSPLTHLWYLGVDIQFFVVWTLLATLFCPKGRSTRLGRRSALVLALVSAVLMAVFYDPNADPTRVYYGPDTRAFAPLLGAWLGLAWPLGGRPVRLDRARHTVRDSIPLAVAGPVGLVGLTVVMVLVPDTSPFLYRGGMLMVALFSVLIIAAALERRSIFSRAFSLPPLVWLGTRSFGLYLWHFPLFQLFKVTNVNTPPALIAVAVALSLIMAELSYRLIEKPISQKKAPLVIGEGPNPYDGGISYLTMVPAALVAIAIAGGATGLILIPDETAVPDEAIKSTGAGAAVAMDLSNRKPSTQSNATSGSSASANATSANATSAKNTNATESKKQENKTSEENKTAEKKEQKNTDDIPTGAITLKASAESIDKGLYTPVIIADSVAGDADWSFAERTPDALLDSYIGRRPDQALEVLKQYLDQGVVGNIVVLDSFSNNPATDETMQQLVDACGNRHVYMVNVRIPEVEQDSEADLGKTLVTADPTGGAGGPQDALPMPPALSMQSLNHWITREVPGRVFKD